MLKYTLYYEFVITLTFFNTKMRSIKIEECLKLEHANITVFHNVISTPKCEHFQYSDSHIRLFSIALYKVIDLYKVIALYKVIVLHKNIALYKVIALYIYALY